MTREHGVHPKSEMSYEIPFFATLTSVLTGKSNARLVGPHFGSNSPLARSKTPVKCPGYAPGLPGFGIDW